MKSKKKDALMRDDEKYFKDAFHYSPEGIDRFSKFYAERLKDVIKTEAMKHTLAEQIRDGNE